MESTTAQQNTIIWSATGGAILLLLGIVGWLINGKDGQIIASIKEVRSNQEISMQRAEVADQKIMENINKLCDRIGGVEGRVSNLEIFIQMPFTQRKELFDNYKKPRQ